MDITLDVKVRWSGLTSPITEYVCKNVLIDYLSVSDMFDRQSAIPFNLSNNVGLATLIDCMWLLLELVNLIVCRSMLSIYPTVHDFIRPDTWSMSLPKSDRESRSRRQSPTSTELHRYTQTCTAASKIVPYVSSSNRKRKRTTLRSTYHLRIKAHCLKLWLLLGAVTIYYIQINLILSKKINSGSSASGRTWD